MAYYVNVPAWPYKDTEKLLERIKEMESLVCQVSYSKPTLRVEVSTDCFKSIASHPDIKQFFQFYVNPNSAREIVSDRIVSDVEEGKNWLLISRTLFVEKQQ